MSTPNVGQNLPYPFVRLSLIEQKEVAKKVSQNYPTSYEKKAVIEALSAMNNPNSETLPPNVQTALDSLNNAAKKILEEEGQKLQENLTEWCIPWKKVEGGVVLLTHNLQKIMAQAALGSAIPAGIAFYYYKWHHVIDIANICAACALWVFSWMCLEASDGASSSWKLLQKLKPETYGVFSSNTIDMYRKLETRFFLGPYLRAHRSKNNNEPLGLAFLWDQLYAFQTLFSPEILGEEPADVTRIKNFFSKLAGFCKYGWGGASALMLIPMASLVCAWRNKACLMALSAAVYAVGLGAVAYEFYVLEEGARKISAEPEDESIPARFNEMVHKSFTLNKYLGAGIKRIFHAVVIPYDAILNLIPGWKTGDAK